MAKGKQRSRSHKNQQNPAGGKIRVPADPQQITRIPWNRLTVPMGGFVGEDVVSFASLHAAIITQLGLTPTNFEVKVKRVRAWGPVQPNNDTQTEIAVSDIIDDENGGLFQPLAVLSDFGNLAKRATLGYQWPLAQQGNVVTTSATHTGTLLECTNVSILYIDIVWKPKFTSTKQSVSKTLWMPQV